MSATPDQLSTIATPGAGIAAPAAVGEGDAALPRLPELDALRGFAAIGVLCLHTLPRQFFWAWSCVDLFFVLSGFLITSILLRHARSGQVLLAFYARRALRIWPVYYLAWLATVALFLAMGRIDGGAWPAIPGGQWLSLVFLQYTDHYLGAGTQLDYLWYFAHSWSLAVEEQFYLLWPLLFLVLRPGLWTVMLLCALGLFGALQARLAGMDFHLLLTRVDGLLFGIALAHLAHTRMLWRLPARVFAYAAACALLLLLPYLLTRGQSVASGLVAQRSVEVAAFCLLYASLVGIAVRWSGAVWLAGLRRPLFVHLGQLSFAIYMYQVPIAYLTLEGVAHGWFGRPVAYALTWIATLALAELSYRAVERPLLRLKRHFPYARAAC